MVSPHSSSTYRKDHERGDQNGTRIHLRSQVSRHIALPLGSRLPLGPKMDKRRVGNLSLVFGIRHWGAQRAPYCRFNTSEVEGIAQGSHGTLMGGRLQKVRVKERAMCQGTSRERVMVYSDQAKNIGSLETIEGQ
ncbi:hypothetical protein Tco_0400153 [Tanacetum coccineum]